MMKTTTDQWVREYEWLEKRLALLQIYPLKLHTVNGLHDIARILRNKEFSQITPEALMQIIKRFEAFSGMKVASYRAPAHPAPKRKVYQRICRWLRGLLHI